MLHLLFILLFALVVNKSLETRKFHFNKERPHISSSRSEQNLASYPKVYIANPQYTDVEFVIFVPSYNNEKWAIQNLQSICYQQSSKPYQVICVNDCSTDQTGQLMEEFVKSNHLESMVTIIHNKDRVGGGANHYNVIHSIPDHKVVVCVDGDDLLTTNHVLLRLEQEYKDPDVWMTYGTMWQMPEDNPLPSQDVSPHLFIEKKFRSHKWVTLALRTFKAGLFKKIKKEDLEYDGTFLTVAWDYALMYPLLEMSAPKHIGATCHFRHIKDLLYIYNWANPISDFRIRNAEQMAMVRYIRSKTPYEPIDQL
jgi:glycosyltransferase involved in cell wall biosynthesis